MQEAATTPQPDRRRAALAAAALAAVTLAVFARALDCEFVNYDDGQYVTKNAHVTSGLSAEGTRWAFTTFYASNWHPLTWLSLQLDATLWHASDGKPDPRGFHLTNVLVHAANASLALLALRSLTGAFWRSLAAALLFAVHPLRVESVAWVSERKDVLSVFFGLLALWAYAGYARAPSVRRYLLVLVSFALSLMAKPTLVTLPCLLLVLDWWPLARWERGAGWRLLREKFAHFALAAASCALTLQAQSARAVITVEELPLGLRLENGLMSYAAYLAKTLWPVGLAPFYPLAMGEITAGRVGVAILVLAALTAGAVTLRGRAPYLLAGWLWYVGALVPAIGLVQVGGQAYADRYTYFPQLGLLLALCWGAADLARGRPAVCAGAVAGAGAALAVASAVQISIWHDSHSLWEHARAVTIPNPIALQNLGETLYQRGERDEAADLFVQATRLDPKAAHAHAYLGRIRMDQKNYAEAAREFEQVTALKPGSADDHNRLGNAYFQLRRLDDAAREFEAASRLAPEQADLVFNQGLVEEQRRNFAPAATYYEKAVQLVPSSAKFHARLGVTLERVRPSAESLDHLNRAVELDPDFGEGHTLLGNALEARDDWKAAAAHYERAARLDPQLALTWYNLGAARTKLGDFAGGAECLARAVERAPAYAPYRRALASALDQLAAAGRADLRRRIEERLQHLPAPAPRGPTP